MKVFIQIIFLFIFNNFQVYGSINNTNNLLVSKTPPDEINSLIPGTNKPFEKDQIFHSLNAAYEYIYKKYGGRSTENITIYIRKGFYFQDYLYWKTTSPTYTTKIISYKGERVIFDGMRSDKTISSHFIRLANKYERTNLWVEGLIIQNYYNGIGLGKSERFDGQYFEEIQNSHNVIRGNIFRKIGNKFAVKGSNIGYSAIGLSNSSYNLITSNVFYEIENDKANAISLIHAVYIANYSSHNVIKENYVSFCSGGPFRIRNGCDNNTFEGNHVEYSGTRGFISEWYRTPEEYPDSFETPSNGTIIGKNIFTFTYPGNGEKGMLFSSNVNEGLLDLNYIDIGGNFVFGTQPSCFKIDAAIARDFDHDGKDEILLAVYYGSFTKVVRSISKQELFFSKVLHVTEDWRVGAFETFEFEESDQNLITAFNSNSNENSGTEIFKGNVESSLTNGGKLFSSPKLKTVAITSGDFDGDGMKEIITAFNSNAAQDKTQIYLGNGSDRDPLTNQGKIFTKTNCITTAMTAGDYDGNGKSELILSVASQNEGGVNTQIFKGNGIGRLYNVGKLLNLSEGKIEVMISAGYNTNGKDDLFIGWNKGGDLDGHSSKILKGNGFEFENLEEFSLNSSVYIHSMVSGNFLRGIDKVLEFGLIISNGTKSYLKIGYNDTFDLKDKYLIGEGNLCLTKSFGISAKSQSYKGDNHNIILYPNPTKKGELVTLMGAGDEFLVSIYSSNGELLRVYKNIRTIPTIELSKGRYYIKIEEMEQSKVLNLIVI